MLLEKDQFQIEKSNDAAPTVDFGIKNPAIIFDILCNKLYENPLKILVQEYMCNARDSHREAGCREKPITVVLPTKIDPTLKITDVGVGISPKRMNTVFIYLGESTKNGSNLETGGFGVGAKVGWAYNDSFTVKTVFDNIKYTYLAYLGDAGIGQLDLLFKEENCNQPNGTTIEITIKESDFRSVYTYVHSTSHFWNVRPFIKNAELLDQKYTDIKYTNRFGDITVIDGQGMDYSSRNRSYLDLNKRVHAVVDGIIYKDIGSRVDGIMDNFKIGSYSAMFIHFGVGEVDLAVNRENLQYTKKTIAAVKKKVETGFKELSSDIDDFLDKYDEIGDIIENLEEIEGSFNFIKSREFIYDHMIFKLERTNGFPKRVTLSYDFEKSALVSKYSLDGAGVLRYATDSAKSSIVLDKDSFKKGNIIFNDKFTKTFQRAKVKLYMYDKDIQQIMVIQPTADKDLFYNQHNGFLSAFDKCVKLSDAAPKAVREKIEGMICYTYDRSSYNAKRYSTRFEKLPKNCTFLFKPYADAYTDQCATFERGIQLYNNVYGTNYKLVVVSKANEKKIKKLGLWKCFHEWYASWNEKVYHNVPTRILFGEREHEFNQRNAFDRRLFHEDVLDPKVHRYFDTLKYVKTQGAKFKGNKSRRDKARLALLRFVLLRKHESLDEHYKMDIVKSLIKRKLKRLKEYEAYILKEYRLVAHGSLNYNTDDSDVVEFMNLKYNARKTQGEV